MFSRLRSFLTAWTRRERFEDGLDEEVRFHLDAYAEDLVRYGMPEREAVRRARLHFGSIAGMKDDCRHARCLAVADELERLMTNVRFGLRMLVKTPVVTGVAVISLALGIGSNAAIFSLFSQVLLRPLPVAEPERLVNLGSSGTQVGIHHHRSGGRQRRDLQLPDVPRSPARADRLHRYRGASRLPGPRDS